MNNLYSLSFLLLLLIFFISSSSLINSQQLYIRNASTGCSNTDPSTSVFGYRCNGVSSSCQSYLTFFSYPPYNTVTSISTLLASDPSQLARLNSVSLNATFESAKSVLVPVNCSCTGSRTFYQVNSTYVAQEGGAGFLSIANNVFQGLTSCVSIQSQNSNISSSSLIPGITRINVPLRCACPTTNQTDIGIRYLVSYVVNWNDTVQVLSSMFGVDTDRTFQANGLSVQDPTIYPNTTLLIPLQNPPNISQINQLPPPQIPQSPPVQITPPPSQGSSSSSKGWIYAVVGVVGGLAVAIISGVLVYFYCFRKKKKEEKKPVVVNKGSTVDTPSFQSIENSDIWDNITDIAKSINVYTYKELQRATEDFNPSFWINGAVYRGVINGDLAAIKKKTGDVSQEINLLNKINHFNLIRLSGVCFDEGQWYLVYEYAANGALSDWINSKKGADSKLLNWKQRIQIALDVATGLNYLHNYTNPPYVHKDLTSHHVFLDGDMRAKIGNIGLARSAYEEGDFALTKHIVGTKGYMAPEYLENGLVSPKLDVYAFGVLLMEIVTGRYVSASSEFRVPLLEGKDAEENLKNFMDPSLKGDYPSELAILVAKLIDSCLQKNPSARPSTDEVVQALSTMMDTTLSMEHKISI